MLEFHHGNWADCLSDLQRFIQMAQERGLEDLLTSELYLCQGMGFIEANNFKDAFESLTMAIAKDPKNKQAYFERAIVQFELGNYEASIEDYFASSYKMMERRYSQAKERFIDGLFSGAWQGGKESLLEFVPNLLSGIRGIGEGVWAYVQDPIGTEERLADTVLSYAKYFRDHVTIDNYDKMASEVRQLYDDWYEFDQKELGQQIGYVIGLYGTDIFLIGGSTKAITLLKDYKRASAIYTLERCAKDEVVLQGIIVAAEERQVAREQLLKSYGNKLKIEADKQGKHIVGHRNYEEGKSIFTHPNPEKLLNEHAGTGLKMNSEIVGQPGYREKVNFGEKIGYFVEETTGNQIETTFGTIHYSKKGAHIEPAFPE